jgi:tetratricopeptide (TPR) repeat protein
VEVIVRCPDEASIIAFAAHELSPAARDVIEGHLAACHDCRRLAFALVCAGGDEPSASAPRPELIGRFEVQRSIARWATGEIYLARDPDLGREVAIKVARGHARDDAAARARLRQEALALARLAHPHVVTVHEVGEHAGTTYLAMEHVDGATLDAWLATPRAPAEVVAVMAGVGRGLAAAHAAGVVHGDVAPRHVLVSADGVAKIGDFGLARRGGEGGDPAMTPGDRDGTAETSLAELVGPPGYLAPERLRGGPATEASDQFAFCVVLHEALFGRRPFAGASAAELAASIERGPVLPATPPLPSGLRRAMRRGLAADPARRFPSMRALVDAITRPRPVARWLVAAAAMAAVIVAAALGQRAGGGGRDACAVDPEAVQVFAAEQRRAVAAALSTAPERGTAIATTVDRMLADYGRRWQASDRASCQRARTGGQPPRLRDYQRACLERRLRRVADLGATLATGAGALDRAARAVDQLPDPETCLRVTAAAPEREPPPLTSALGMAVVDRMITRMLSLEATGQAAAAAPAIDAVVAAARSAGDPPLLARALLAQGWVYAGTERYREVEPLLDEAARHSAAGHDDELTAEIWTLRAYFVGYSLGRIEEARRWMGVAEAAVLRAGDPPALRVMLHSLAGRLWTRAGEHARAESALRAALAIVQRERPGALLSIADAHGNLAYTLANARDPEARPLFEAALAMYRATYGERHPDVITTLTGLGDLLVESEPRRAVEYLEQARRTAEALRGPRSGHAMRALIGLGVAHRHLGELATAIELQRTAADAFRERFGDNHELAAYARGRLGDSLLVAGDVAAAVAAHRQAVATFARVLGPLDMPLASARGDLARSLEAAGDLAGATASAEAAVSAFDRASSGGGAVAAGARVVLGALLLPDDAARACRQFAVARDALVGADDRGRDDAVAALAGLVQCDVIAGSPDRARLLELEQALATVRRLEPAEAAWIAYARARGHAALGDAATARAHGAAARDGFAQATLRRRRDQVERWLRTLR